MGALLAAPLGTQDMDEIISAAPGWWAVAQGGGGVGSGQRWGTGVCFLFFLGEPEFCFFFETSAAGLLLGWAERGPFPRVLLLGSA